MRRADADSKAGGVVRHIESGTDEYLALGVDDAVRLAEHAVDIDADAAGLVELPMALWKAGTSSVSSSQKGVATMGQTPERVWSLDGGIWSFDDAWRARSLHIERRELHGGKTIAFNY